MGYDGPERRIHRVLVTRNTEYHVRKRTCVGVRDRRTGGWIPDHVALRQRVAGSFAFGEPEARVNLTGVPEPGECVFFEERGAQLITSPVLSVRRPPKKVVLTQYPPA